MVLFLVLPYLGVFLNIGSFALRARPQSTRRRKKRERGRKAKLEALSTQCPFATPHAGRSGRAKFGAEMSADCGQRVERPDDEVSRRMPWAWLGGGGGPNFVGHFGEAGVRPIHQPSDTAADTRAGQGTTAEPTAQTVFPPRCRPPQGLPVLIGRLSQSRRDAPNTPLFTAHAQNGSPGFATTERVKERSTTVKGATR